MPVLSNLTKTLPWSFFKLLWIMAATNFLLAVISIRFFSVISNNDRRGCGYDKITRIQTNKPVIAWWTPYKERLRERKVLVCPNRIICNILNYENCLPNDLETAEGVAYLFYGFHLQLSQLPVPRKPQTIWALIHDDSNREVPQLMHERALNLFNFSATFSRHSDVPFPLQFMRSLGNITSKEYFVETHIKNTFLMEISPIIYLQSNCDTATERNDYVRELMEFIKIDCYGHCLRNKYLPSTLPDEYLVKLYDDSTLKFIAKYKFIIAIENSVSDDYVTEKLWRSIHMGVVPIYFGSPSIRDWLPNENSAILLEDFPTPKLLSEHIKLLLRNDSLYEEYLEHKTKGIIRNKRLVDEIKARPYQTDSISVAHEFECFLCKKMHDIKNQTKVHIVNKAHYNFPQPISALTLKVNPSNKWVRRWKATKHEAHYLYRSVMYGTK